MDSATGVSRRGVVAGAASVAALTGIAAADARPPVVQTGFGPVRGAVVDGINVFKGVRYGAPPVGALRFRPPQPPTPWTAPADAVAYGSPAVQMNPFASAETPAAADNAMAEIFPNAQETRDGREDCLFLNVWTPGLGDGERRPVMVWLHGGGFAHGSGGWPMYDGANLARRGELMVVTVNHRLNAFGFAYLAEAMGEAYADSGNAGLLDLVAALRWVRDNAAAFGGDPGNVTIFGESGGGAKVSTLMAAPLAKGLFHKAVVQSGPGLRGVPRAAAAANAEKMLAQLKIAKGDVAALQAVPASEVVRAAFALGGVMTLGPVVDGRALPRNPFTPDAPPQSAGVPVMIGTNKDESTLFTAFDPSFGRLTEADVAARARAQGGPAADAVLAALRKIHPDYGPGHLLAAYSTSTTFWGGSVALAERKAAQKAAPVWMYRLDWETPIAGGVLKSPHMLEIPLIFDNVERSRGYVGPGPAPQALAEQMSAAWIAFARTGDPSTPRLAPWPPYEPPRRATMIFDLESRIQDDPWPELRQAVQT